MKILISFILVMPAISASAGNMYIYKDKGGQVALTNVTPSGNFDKFSKKVRVTYYRDLEAYPDSHSEISSSLDEISSSLKEYQDQKRDEYYKLAKKPDARIGMSKNQVLNNTKWGKPQNINTTIEASGTSERWIYGNSHYLYFKNGKLTKIEK